MTVLIALVVIIAFMLLLEKMCERIWVGKIRVKVNFDKKEVNIGQELRIDELVVNRSRFYFPYIYLKYDINRNGEPLRSQSGVFSLLSRQKVTRHIPYHFDKRGRYDVGMTYIVFKGLFLRSTLEHMQEQRSRIIVYPKIKDVSDIPVYTFITEGDKEHNPRLYEDRLAFRDIREYTDTDDMSRINWNATAKSDELMVNTYEDMRRAAVRIVLELPDKYYEDSDRLLEENISIAASLYVEMLDKKIPVSVVSNGIDAYTKCDVYIQEKNSESYEKEALESFARMVAPKDVEDSGILINEDISSRTSIIFISQMGDVNKGLRGQVFELAQKGYRILWVVVATTRDEMSVDEARQKVCDFGLENYIKIFVWDKLTK